MVRAMVWTALAGVAAVASPAIVLPVAGPAAAARVVFFDRPQLSVLPDGVTIDRWEGRQAILAGVDARAARKLYSQGALLVFPVRVAGCLALSAI